MPTDNEINYQSVVAIEGGVQTYHPLGVLNSPIRVIAKPLHRELFEASHKNIVLFRDQVEKNPITFNKHVHFS